jgi:hypothetical protein
MEWGSSIFIIVVFIFLGFYVATSVGIQSIQENWPQYRCNPVYMPFASTLAPVPTTASKNFSFCMQDFMKSAAPALTQPFSYVQSMTVALMGTMAEGQQKNTEKTTKQSFSISNLFKQLFSVIGGIIAQFKIMLVKMMNAQAKMMGAVSTVLYILVAVQNSFVSMLNGIPGALIQFMGKH